MNQQATQPRILNRATLGAMVRFVLLVFILQPSSFILAQDRFPPPEFRSGYNIPKDQFPLPPEAWWNGLDVGLLAATLALASWLVFYRRSRRGVFLLSLFALAWFGFVRKGCVCPIGAIQNVAEATFSGAALPWTVAAFFALPLIIVFVFGRVFCSAVCPLGALQDLFTWKTLRIPRPVEVSLSLLAYLYLGLAVMFAALGGPYIICQYDPFVPLFRLNGPAYMLFIGGVLLALGLFVGRPYCRFLCPYGVLLRLASRFSRKRVTITPDQCINCHLCQQSCPYGAIRKPTQAARPVALLEGKRTLVVMLLAAPLIVAALAVAGYASSNALSQLHLQVQLAEEVAADQRGQVAIPSAQLSFFKSQGQSPNALYAHVVIIQRQFRIGAMIVGIWMGLVISGKLIAHSIRRIRTDYTADTGACLACARCYTSCPVELKRRGVIQELPTVLPT